MSNYTIQEILNLLSQLKIDVEKVPFKKSTYYKWKMNNTEWHLTRINNKYYFEKNIQRRTKLSYFNYGKFHQYNVKSMIIMLKGKLKNKVINHEKNES